MYLLVSYFRAERMKESARSTYCTLAFVSLQHNPSTIDLPLPDAKQEKNWEAVWREASFSYPGLDRAVKWYGKADSASTTTDS